jgi:biotin operon repressor
MKSEKEIRKRLSELKDEWLQVGGNYKHGHVLNMNIKLLEWVLDESNEIEVSDEE